MGWFVNLMIVVQVLCALAVVILVLLQHGKGADMGAAFGSGASGSLFGASGSANFLSRTTAIVFGLFLLATVGMAYSTTSSRAARGGLMGAPVPAAPAPAGAPAAAQPLPQQVPQDTSAPPAAPAPHPAAPADKPADIPK